ncbi:MAG: DUF4214 domain-containing protein [Clostridiales bacterium]|nr:DUF4214 domain-containing protein [Clostridiales bacterium]
MWSELLSEGKATGTSVAYGFIFSNEFQSKDISNEAYVEHMYEAFMGRPSDPDGKDMWVSYLENGMSRSKLFEGFAASVEFGRICNSYGIVCGNYIDGADVDRISSIDLFVTRLYGNILGRLPDTDGLRSWTLSLFNGDSTGAQAAYGFFFSNEYMTMDKSSEAFVADLYETLLGRHPDPSGISSWVDLLDRGYSRERIFNGFIMSQEFGQICEQYGLIRGDEIDIPDDYLWITSTALGASSVVFVEATGQSTAKVTFVRRDLYGEWDEIFTVYGYIGRNGLGKVRQGDNKTPVGVYHFTDAFGICEDPGCPIPYTVLTPDLYWSGDPDLLYNRMVSIIDHPDLSTRESEHLIDYAPNYDYCLNISYNEEGTPGAGSAIFLHCTGRNAYTAGCVAIPEEQMRLVIQNVSSDTLIVIDTSENIRNLTYAG